MRVTPPGVAAVVVAAVLAVTLTGCTASAPHVATSEASDVARPSRAAATPTPTPTVSFPTTHTVVGATVDYQGDRFGPHGVLIDSVLYSDEHAAPIQVPEQPGQDETYTSTALAIEQDPAAPLTVVRAETVHTAAEGINAVPDHIRLDTFDSTGRLLHSVDLPASDLGWHDGGADDAPTETLSVVDGIAVMNNEPEDAETWSDYAVQASSGTVLWTGPSDTRESSVPCAGFFPTADTIVTCIGDHLESLDVRTGAVHWQQSGYGATDIGSRRFFQSFDASDDRSVVDATTGVTIATDVENAIADPTTGRVAITFDDDTAPLLRTISATGADVYDVPRGQNPGLTEIDLDAAFDGRLWVDAGSGLDIVSETTGTHDRSVPPHDQTADRTAILPVAGTATWTWLEDDMSNDSSLLPKYHDVLVRHPAGDSFTFSDLTLFEPAS